MKTDVELNVIAQLLAHMHSCRRRNVSFADCMADARQQFNREVAEEALTRPMPEK